MNYPRAEANPPHPFTKVEAVALEDVVNYLEPTQPTQATTKALWEISGLGWVGARRVKDAVNKMLIAFRK